MQCFQHRAIKSTLEFFIFSKFELVWAACIFVKIHNRQTGISIEQFFFKVLRWLCLWALDQSEFLVVLSKIEIELLIFRKELNKKQNCTTNHNFHAIFSAKGSKEYAGIFLFSKFELFWAAFIFVKIHNRQIGIWIEHFFSKSSDGSAWKHLINQSS